MEKRYQYFVEGKDEEKFISVLKTDMLCIIPGKVQKLNVIEEKITMAKLRTLKKSTVVILVFDTDTNNIDILKSNIELLKKHSSVCEVWCVTQVKSYGAKIQWRPMTFYKIIRIR